MNTTSPTACPAWKKLAAHARRAPAIAGGARLAQAQGVTLDYSRQRVDTEALALLAQLASERGFDEWRAALFAGGKINSTEGRAVGHTAARADQNAVGKLRDSGENLPGQDLQENRQSRRRRLGPGPSSAG